MSDTLIIGGQTYNNVAGIKATNSNNTVLTYTNGGGGLVYETGTYTPVSDIAQPTISFANTHTTTPISIAIIDNSQGVISADSVSYWVFNDWYNALGKYVCTTGTTALRYAKVSYGYKSSSSYSESTATISNLTGTNSTSLPYYISTSEFKPYSGSATRYFRSGSSYEWIAVWAPTT